MKKAIALVLFISVSLTGVFAISHLSVPLGDRVYEILRSAELRGMIDQVGTVKPYPRSLVVRNLEAVLQHPDVKASERGEIMRILKRFDDSFTSPKGFNEALMLGGYQSYWDEYRTGVVFGVEAGTTITKSLTVLDSYDARIRLRPYMRGDISDFLSFQMDFGLVLDRLDARLFPPNDFTFDTDGKYDSIFNIAEQHRFYYGQFNEPELALSFLDGNLQLRWGAMGRDWGVARNNLMIAGSARPFQGIETSITLTSWLNYQFIAGSLGKFSPNAFITDPVENAEFFNDYFFADGQQGTEYLNNVSAHRFELNLPWGVSLGIYESVVYRQRFELGYLNPFSILMFEQINIGDFDNMFAGVDAQVLIPGFGRLYAALATTEMNDIRPDRFLKAPRNIMGFQAGVDLPLPVGDFGTVTFQYTYLGPFFYTHYPIEQSVEVEGKEYVYEVWKLDYVNKGRPLGYPMQPNSDELLLRGTLGIRGGWEFEALLKYQRRSGQYGFTMKEHMVYKDADKYHDKAFNANVFEQLFSLEAGVEKRFEDLPFTVTGRYLFHIKGTRTHTPPAAGEYNWSVGDAWSYAGRSHTLQLGVKVWY